MIHATLHACVRTFDSTTRKHMRMASLRAHSRTHVAIWNLCASDIDETGDTGHSFGSSGTGSGLGTVPISTAWTMGRVTNRCASAHAVLQ